MNPLIKKITGAPVEEMHVGMPPGGPGGEGVEDAGGAPPAPPMPPEGGEGGEGGWEDWQERLLNAIKERFVRERVEGFTAPTGQTYPPVPPEEAEQRWTRAEPRFREVISNDPTIRERFGGGAPAAPEGGPAADQAPAEVEPEGAPPEEPPYLESKRTRASALAKKKLSE